MSTNSNMTNTPDQTTQHTGHVHFTNNWGLILSTVYLRHRRGNDSSKEESVTLKNVTLGKLSDVLTFTYETGAGSPFDYWWIKFLTFAGTEYKIKENFYCYVSSSDDGNVDIALEGDIHKMTVGFSNSSGCKQSIDCVNSPATVNAAHLDANPALQGDLNDMLSFYEQLIDYNKIYACKDGDVILGRYVREALLARPDFEASIANLRSLLQSE